jgi:hypothetical protein
LVGEKNKPNWKLTNATLKTKKQNQPLAKLGKLKYVQSTQYRLGIQGELRFDSAERTTNLVVDPLNLNQIILAKGKK